MSFNLDTLPKNCIETICSHLETKDVVSLSQVNKKLSTMRDWKYFLNMELHYLMPKIKPLQERLKALNGDDGLVARAKKAFSKSQSKQGQIFKTLCQLTPRPLYLVGNGIIDYYDRNGHNAVRLSYLNAGEELREANQDFLELVTEEADKNKLYAKYSPFLEALRKKLSELNQMKK